jgi:nucleoid-associated protein YgaU
MNRYISRTKSINDEEQYEQQFQDRGIKKVYQYETPKFTYPSKEVTRSLTIIDHVWSESDRLYKLADKYYGDSKLWWAIAKFNNLPTEAHIKIGYTLKIPLQIDTLLSVMRG